MKEQKDLFSLIGRTLEKKIECYVVGGTAMMFLNLKQTTKDIDIVFVTKQDYNEFKETLKKLGAKEAEKKVINPEKEWTILDFGDIRFDLFLEDLINFKLTETIQNRIVEVHEFGNFIIKVISPEDIIFFKSMTNRQTDRVDVADIIKKVNVNWNLVLEESEEQMKYSEYVFPAFVYNFLIETKEDFDIEIPKDFLKKLEKIVKKGLIEARDRLKRQDKKRKENKKKAR